MPHDAYQVDVTNPPIFPAARLTPATGTLSANPNPISVCDESGLGITTISWTVQDATTIEIHVGRPNGDLFTRSEQPSGEASTNKWVKDGTLFYLQDVSDGRPLKPEQTIAILQVHVNRNGCP